jgi:hypothetical protein
LIAISLSATAVSPLLIGTATAAAMNYIGNWNYLSSYPAGSVVTYGNQTFYAVAASVNQNPISTFAYWQLLGTNGNTINNGSGSPTLSMGTVGDFYIDTTNKRLYGPKSETGWPTAFASLIGPAGANGASGPKGPAGAPGAAGAAGKSLLNGTAAPITAVGAVGDFYIDTTNNRLYGPKTAAGWPSTFVSVVGAAGSRGATGPSGPAGVAGAAGAAGKTILNGAGVPAAALGTVGDFYLDTAGKLFYGPKTAAGWGTGTMIVQGATGATGATGPRGPAGAVGATGPQGPAGATGSFQNGSAIGNMLYWDGGRWIEIPAPSAPVASLQFCNGRPSWSCNTTVTYNVGDTGPAGGVIFWVAADRSYAMEASKSDWVSSNWGCLGVSQGLAQNTGIGQGLSNTNTIVQKCFDLDTPAKISSDYSQNGFSDWFIPSRDELAELRSKNNLICSVGCDPGNYYWSSNESSSTLAWYNDFLTGRQGSVEKTAALHFRVIRYVR